MVENLSSHLGSVCPARSDWLMPSDASREFDTCRVVAAPRLLSGPLNAETNQKASFLKAELFLGLKLGD